MKRRFIFLFCVLISVCLAGCTPDNPADISSSGQTGSDIVVSGDEAQKAIDNLLNEIDELEKVLDELENESQE